MILSISIKLEFQSPILIIGLVIDREIEERVEEMKERDREERGTGMNVKKQKK